MEGTPDFTRRVKRLSLALPIRVFCRESSNYEWTEQSRLIDVTQFGAGFTLTRPVDVGRLIQLTIPLPQKLRCFDHIEPMYAVWSLVRHAAAISKVNGDSSTLFRIGVGFVGKEAPFSYQEDPTLRYEPVPVKVGQKSVFRLGRHRVAGERRESRLIIPLEVMVETLDEQGKPALQEHTVTETLSSLGACVPTNLDVGVGRIVKVSGLRDQVSIFAAVRSRSVARDGITRLGLEFIGGRWPLER
ncbi:MAG TPA: hypothetical protein VE961_17170 [Pyrinomonadaceae bacterium]|nr:hypothetical protein [Pyrinomonadaceae bacterium]